VEKTHCLDSLRVIQRTAAHLVARFCTAAAAAAAVALVYAARPSRTLLQDDNKYIDLHYN